MTLWSMTHLGSPKRRQTARGRLGPSKTLRKSIRIGTDTDADSDTGTDTPAPVDAFQIQQIQ